MNFIVQKINGELTLDFCQELRNQQRYWEWRGNPFSIMYVETEIPKDINNPHEYIPIGSIEFVKSYINYYYPRSTKCLEPMNIPDVLLKYSGRWICSVKSESYIPDSLKQGTELFRKSLSTLKDSGNGQIKYFSYQDLVGYQISEVIPEIKSEWRVFVHKSQVKQVCYYSGDPLCFPNSSTIVNMIRDYKDSPVAYTLDVWISSEGKTYIMEVHRFFSCGLYGFSDPSLPYMFSQGWYEMIRL